MTSLHPILHAHDVNLFLKRDACAISWCPSMSVACVSVCHTLYYIRTLKASSCNRLLVVD